MHIVKAKKLILVGLIMSVVIFNGYLIPLVVNAQSEQGIDFNSIKTQAEKGDANAQYMLGISFRDGQENVSVNFSKAADWFKRAAKRGHPAAQQELGSLYKYGLGVEQDYAEALIWLKKAAAQGNAEAHFKIGNMYAEARGVPLDMVESNRWIREYFEVTDSKFATVGLSSLEIADRHELLKESVKKTRQSKKKTQDRIEKECTFVARGADDFIISLKPEDAVSYWDCAEPIYLNEMLPIVPCPDIYQASRKRYRNVLSRYHSGVISGEELYRAILAIDGENNDDCLVRMEQQYNVRLL